MTTRKILCLGDLHLGVRPSRLPPDLDPRDVSVATVWRRAVDLAIREEVGLVLLSGDVVDRANRYFEGFSALEEGVSRLAESGAQVVAVAGNHDAEVLERLSAVVSGEGYRFLGAGGRWERYTASDPQGRPVLHVDGWSFPGRDVRHDPVADYGLEPPADGAPVLGLVHGDLDRVTSTNAPLSRSSLEAAGPAGWFLGHLHRPELIDLAGGKWALYPGSPQPLDPTEEGLHGAWLLEIEAGRVGRPELLPLATVRWESVAVDLSGAEALESAETRIVREVRGAVEELSGAGGTAPAWLCLRLRLTGATGLHRRLPELARRLEQETPLELPAGEGRARVVEVACATRPAPDLEGLAQGDSPASLLASQLLALEGGEGADSELLRRVEERLREVYDKRPYLGLGGSTELGSEEVRRLLADGVATLLDALLAARPGPSGEAESREERV